MSVPPLPYSRSRVMILQTLLAPVRAYNSSGGDASATEKVRSDVKQSRRVLPKRTSAGEAARRLLGLFRGFGICVTAAEIKTLTQRLRRRTEDTEKSVVQRVNRLRKKASNRFLRG